ncbi:VOC family protein [Hydrogenophaga sp. PAMC20947]|uniref:bleomycin resistance protein n=1 Tax=Hydrogenophaga sp. PAMC20947 TaxID=2565558 RepID=UPI00109DCDF7|nr:VOC family protein [Hydrogenophaga sp. PAMC20947]QCB47542.1 VOC family protein [Hydrogenophaga sp. PAMC20947]
MPQTVIPQLRITQGPRSLAFYVEQLGFSIDWQHQFEPGFPLFFQLTREGQTLFLTEHAGDCEIGGAVYFRVPDAEAYHTAFAARGVIATNPPSPTPWDTLEFLLTDPDGNRLRFASDLAPPAQA